METEVEKIPHVGLVSVSVHAKTHQLTNHGKVSPGALAEETFGEIIRIDGLDPEILQKRAVKILERIKEVFYEENERISEASTDTSTS